MTSVLIELLVIAVALLLANQWLFKLWPFEKERR